MLRSDLWAAAFVRRHNDLGEICVVSQRGDPIAGQIFIEIDHLNGTVSLLTPAPSTARAEGDEDRLFVRRFGRVVSCLGWGTHSLAPLSFKGAAYSGVFTLVPLLTGEGRRRHGEILEEATKLAEAGQLIPRLDPRRFTLATADDAHVAITDGSARGKIVVEIAR